MINDKLNEFWKWLGKSEEEYAKNGLQEYVNNHKEENKMKLFNKLPLEINDFETIIPYLGLCNLFFEKLGFLLGSYNMTSGVFVPSNEVKQIYKLSK